MNGKTPLAEVSETQRRLSPFLLFVLLFSLSLAFGKGTILAFLDYAVPLGYNGGAVASWYFVYGGLGWVVPALFKVPPQKAMLPGAAALLLLGISMAALSAYPQAVTAAILLSAFAVSVFQYSLICGMFRKIPYNRRGTAFGLACGLSTLINLPSRLAGLPLPALQTVMGQLLFAIVLIGLVFALVLLTRNRQPAPVGSGDKEKANGIPARLIFWIMVCLFCMYVAYGMYNYMLDAYQFGRAAEFEYARIADVFANILIGVLCDYVGRPVTLVASAVLMMSGALLTLTGFNGTVAVVLQALSIVGVLCFTIPIRLILVDTSSSSKYPYLICSLGFIGVNWFYSAGAPLAEAAMSVGEAGPFTVNIVLCLLVIPLITYIVGRIRRAHMDNEREVIAQTDKPELNADADRLCREYGLTRRESQVFRLSLVDKSAMAIAQDLMVSETTIRVHLRNIRQKMENGNNGRALEAVLTERDEALHIDSPVSRGEMHRIADEYSLTGREVEVFPYLLTPKTADEIADELFIAPSTVRTHIRNIIAKTGATGRSELEGLVSAQRDSRMGSRQTE